MPCPHNEITIVQRSQRQSAVAAAAYQSGEKLFCEYDQQVKHYPEKRGIVHNEILLPANAPRSYADRNTLWNAAEAVEKQWNSQLARRWVLTIPREIPPDQYTKGRTKKLDEGWTEPGNFTGLKGSQRSPVLSSAKGTFHCGGLRSVSGSVREISRRLPQSDEAKGSPKQSD